MGRVPAALELHRRLARRRASVWREARLDEGRREHPGNDYIRAGDGEECVTVANGQFDRCGALDQREVGSGELYRGDEAFGRVFACCGGGGDGVSGVFDEKESPATNK